MAPTCRSNGLAYSFHREEHDQSYSLCDILFQMARSEFLRTKDPMDSAIFYLAMHKPTVLASLFKYASLFFSWINLRFGVQISLQPYALFFFSTYLFQPRSNFGVSLDFATSFQVNSNNPKTCCRSLFVISCSDLGHSVAYKCGNSNCDLIFRGYQLPNCL